MSIQSEINRINEAKASIIAALRLIGNDVPDDISIDELSGYIAFGNADTVDGFHLAVINKGEAVPQMNTIVFVKGG